MSKRDDSVPCYDTVDYDIVWRILTGERSALVFGCA
jgi:hypothetical protein